MISRLCKVFRKVFSGIFADILWQGSMLIMSLRICFLTFLTAQGALIGLLPDLFRCGHDFWDNLLVFSTLLNEVNILHSLTLRCLDHFGSFCRYNLSFFHGHRGVFLPGYESNHLKPYIWCRIRATNTAPPPVSWIQGRKHSALIAYAYLNLHTLPAYLQT